MAQMESGWDGLRGSWPIGRAPQGGNVKILEVPEGAQVPKGYRDALNGLPYGSGQDDAEERLGIYDALLSGLSLGDGKKSSPVAEVDRNGNVIPVGRPVSEVPSGAKMIPGQQEAENHSFPLPD